MQELRGEPRLLKHYFCGHIYLDGSDHGSALKSLDLSLTMNRREDTPTFSSRSLGLWILGLGTQYPSHLLGPEKLDAFVKRFHDVENPGCARYSLRPDHDSQIAQNQETPEDQLRDWDQDTVNSTGLRNRLRYRKESPFNCRDRYPIPDNWGRHGRAGLY